jgi:hypothetical protein
MLLLVLASHCQGTRQGHDENQAEFWHLLHLMPGERMDSWM